MKRVLNMRKIILYKVKIILQKIINKMIIKERNRLLFEALENCEKDKYDIINYSSDTILSLLNYWIENPPSRTAKIYLVVHHPERLKIYKDFIIIYLLYLEVSC